MNCLKDSCQFWAVLCAEDQKDYYSSDSESSENSSEASYCFSGKNCKIKAFLVKYT